MTSKPQDTRVPRHARLLRGHAVTRTVGLVVVAALAGLSGGAYGVARHLQGNLSTSDTSFLTKDNAKTKKSADPSDPEAGNALNILILGSDSRAGANGSIVKDDNAGQRSDTTIVMHISANRKRVEMISIPRDSLVDIPACQIDSKGDSTGASPSTMFNSAFAFGADRATALGKSKKEQIAAGAACTWQTVEANTGITIDGYVVLDFAGFEDMINALGGVPMCIPEAVDVPKADLKLAAGYQTLKGKAALGYARAREGIGDGSDLSRIKRQQDLMAAMANKVFAQNFLTNSPKLLSFLDATTKSLYMSKGEGGLDLGSITSLMGLAFSLRGVSTSDITFLTIPNGTAPTNPNRVVWTQPQAQDVWDKVKKDKPITAAEEAATKAEKSTSTGSSTGSSTGKATDGTGTSGSKTTGKSSSSPSATKNRDTDGLSASESTSKAACTS